jgi:protein-tyrosine kinase
LFDWAGRTYDIVLIDSSSQTAGADAMIVATKAGAALAVARANETNIAVYADLIAELKRSNVKVVGSVLNDPPLIDVVA